MKETYTATLARLAERLENLIDTNKTDHAEAKVCMGKLTEHVNHENQAMDIRLKFLEERQKEEKIQDEQRIRIFKTGISLITIVSILLSIAHYLHFMGI